MAEVDGVVHYGEIVKGSRKILVRTDDGEEREYSIPRELHVNVQEGERVRAGDAFTDGPKDPHKILEILGERELQKSLLDGIQEVYRLQGVNINDKHIEVIIRQMMRWIKVEYVGDTEFIVDEQVDRFRFVDENERVLSAGGAPARGRHNCRIGSGMIVYPARTIESDVVLAASHGRRIIDHDVSFADSDHHKLKFSELHQVLYHKQEKGSSESW